ncbi:MAG: hypothetical protein HFF77_11160, partial [Oscillospiraceae bacterium]|nr:hypothetical protein [Oscillospiraceae bacterium]
MAGDDLLSRQMPHSLEAEQAALGAMLIDADCIKDVMDKLVPEDFYIQHKTAGRYPSPPRRRHRSAASPPPAQRPLLFLS